MSLSSRLNDCLTVLTLERQLRTARKYSNHMLRPTKVPRPRLVMIMPRLRRFHGARQRPKGRLRGPQCRREALTAAVKSCPWMTEPLSRKTTQRDLRGTVRNVVRQRRGRPACHVACAPCRRAPDPTQGGSGMARIPRQGHP